MNRTIKVSRAKDPLLSIRIEIQADDVSAYPVYLSLTPDEAMELQSILHLFQYNEWISSLTGSVGGLRVATADLSKKP